MKVKELIKELIKELQNCNPEKDVIYIEDGIYKMLIVEMKECRYYTILSGVPLDEFKP